MIGRLSETDGCAPDDHELLPLVRASVTFEGGIRVERRRSGPREDLLLVNKEKREKAAARSAAIHNS